MLPKRAASSAGEKPQQIDEGWWASVLGDEEAFAASQKQSGNRPQPAPITVDWERVQHVFETDEIISLEVYGFNRGGALVQGEEMQGFVPISHLVDMPNNATEEERRQVLNAYVSRTLELKVIECEPAQERIVLSERAALAGEGRRRQLFHSLKAGEIVHGSVTNVTDFGVFVDLGGLEGLIHVSELSWGRVSHPSVVLQVSQPVDALVLMISEETGRVALSLKRLQANPWDVLVSNYHTGDVIAATVTKIMRFGAFAKLSEGVEGLIHISTIHLPPGHRELDGYLLVGQQVQVRILHIDAERRRLGLGLVNGE